MSRTKAPWNRAAIPPTKTTCGRSSPQSCGHVLQHAEQPCSVVPVGHAALPQRKPSCRKAELRSRSGWWRQHEADVLAPAGLAKRHRAFRWRVVMGPGYRAVGRAGGGALAERGRTGAEDLRLVCLGLVGQARCGPRAGGTPEWPLSLASSGPPRDPRTGGLGGPNWQPASPRPRFGFLSGCFVTLLHKSRANSGRSPR